MRSSVLAYFALGLLLVGCSGASSAEPGAAPNWPKTLESAKAVHAIESLFRDGTKEERARSEPVLRAFISKFPADPQCLNVRLRLAWLLASSDRVTESVAIVKSYGALARGVDRDWLITTEGAILRRRGQSALALEHLQTLEGRIVDAPLRELWSEETTLAALESSHVASALRVMMMWRASTPEDRAHVTQMRIESLVSGIEPGRLAPELEPLEKLAALPVAENVVSQSRSGILELVRARLAGFAIERNDAALARRLLDSAPARFVQSATGETLREISTRGSTPVLVMQPAVGLLLEMQNAWQSRRSAELVTGAMRALGQSSDAFPIRLINREIRDGSQSAILDGLTALVRDGAAIIISGLSDDTRLEAYALSETQHVVVISLSGGSENQVHGSHWFMVESAEAAIFRALPRESRGGPTRIGFDSAPCKSEEPRCLSLDSGAPRRDKTDLLLLTDETCARRVLESCESEGRLGRVWLGPEMLLKRSPQAGTRRWTSPRLSGQAASDVTADWQKRFERMPFWYEALGYDVVTLAAQALTRLGDGPVSGAEAINRQRTRVVAALLQAQAELLTSTATGFDLEHRLSPSLRESDFLGDRTRDSD